MLIRFNIRWRRLCCTGKWNSLEQTLRNSSFPGLHSREKNSPKFSAPDSRSHHNFNSDQRMKAKISWNEFNYVFTASMFTFEICFVPFVSWRGKKPYLILFSIDVDYWIRHIKNRHTKPNAIMRKRRRCCIQVRKVL